MATDAELNSYMGIKRYAPYRKEGKGKQWDKTRISRLQELRGKLSERGVAHTSEHTAGERPKKRKGKKERMRQRATVAMAGEGDADDDESEESVTKDTKADPAPAMDLNGPPKKKRRRHHKGEHVHA